MPKPALLELLNLHYIDFYSSGNVSFLKSLPKATEFSIKDLWNGYSFTAEST